MSEVGDLPELPHDRRQPDLISLDDARVHFYPVRGVMDDPKIAVALLGRPQSRDAFPPRGLRLIMSLPFFSSK